jgi:acetyl esterase
MPIDPQAQAFLDEMIAAGGPPLHESSVEEARAVTASLPEILGPGPEIASVRDITIRGPAGEISARVYEPTDDETATVVYYHGGGWVIGSVDDWDASVRSLAKECGLRVVSVDYRLAPEHRYPAAVDDAYAAACWAAEEYEGALVLCGDSAGGNLAAVSALRARGEDGPEIAFQALVYPVTDHALDTPSAEEYAEAPLILNRLGMLWFWDHYLPDVARRAEPFASPLRAGSFEALPPAFVLLAEHDPLLDEGVAYAEALEAAGVAVTVRQFDEQIHGFFTLLNAMDSAAAAHRETGRAIRRAVGAG